MKRLLIGLLLASPVTIAIVWPLTASAASSQTDLGDLSSFETIIADTIALVEKGDLVAANKRITDYETAWDAAETKLYPLNKATWGVIDDASDAALDALREDKTATAKVRSSLAALVAALQNSAAN